MFKLIRDAYGIRSALYGGSFVHVTPSFFIPTVTYIDMDRRAARFFESGEAEAVVAANADYDESPTIRFLHQSYSDPFEIEPVDLLISQYGGFVSEACSQHIRPGGFLVANNSHGDAGVAECDPRLRLVGVLRRNGEIFRLAPATEFFVPKRATLPDDPAERARHLRSLGRGVGYTKTAFSYLFQKTEE